jgi:hypothetical protein
MRNSRLRTFNQRVASGRTSTYSAWLEQQPPERRRELIVGEARYLRGVNDPAGARAAAAKDFMTALRGVAAVDSAPAT